jgi:predicted SPOUT superfamily RNA methylase MTH1
VNYTLCIPTSIIAPSNAKNLQQATAILYQIAKAASIYNVAEIVIMDTLKEIEQPIDISEVDSSTGKKKIKFDDIEAKESKNDQVKNEVTEQAMIIASILQYFVTPPYLTKTIFKQRFFHNFQYAKNFPTLTTLPFMNEKVDSKYREGLTVQMGKIHKPQGLAKKKSQPLRNTKYVNIGYDKYLELSGQSVPTNVRVTVDTESKKVVSPLEAYNNQVGAKSSYGYHVRIAKSFTAVFTESSYPEGYSQSIWINSADYFHNSDVTLPKFKISKSNDLNLLLVVSKWSDIEFSFNQDKKNLDGVESAREFFDGEIEIPSGTRIEDGAMIALTKVSGI